MLSPHYTQYASCFPFTQAQSQLCLHLTSFYTDVSTTLAVAVALHAFLLEHEWTDMTKASPHSPPAQCIVLSITSPVPHATIVTFTDRQAEKSKHLSYPSSPQLPLVLPQAPQPGTEGTVVRQRLGLGGFYGGLISDL